MRQTRAIAAFFWFTAVLLTGCDGASPQRVPPGLRVPPGVVDPVEAPPVTAVRPIDPPSAPHGYYRGYATIDGTEYGAEGLITYDGEVRLYAGAYVSPGSGSLGPPDFDPFNPNAHFVGLLALDGNSYSGAGTVISQLCEALSPGRYCGQSVAAEISVRPVVLISGRPGVIGEVRFLNGSETEIWAFELERWSIHYTAAAHYKPPTGDYIERLAPFAQNEELGIAIDADGFLTFASPSTGCAGNGAAVSHADGRYPVFDVELLISGCTGEYASLNGTFRGLATTTQDGAWSYDSWLVMLLSSAGDSAPPVALALYSEEYWWDYWI